MTLMLAIGVSVNTVNKLVKRKTKTYRKTMKWSCSLERPLAYKLMVMVGLVPPLRNKLTAKLYSQS